MWRSALVLSALVGCGSPTAPSAPPAPPAPAPLPPAPAWQWDSGEPGPATTFYRGPITIADPGGLACEYRYDHAEHRDHLECRDRSGARVWGRDRAGAHALDAALLRHGETLFVARFSNVSSGGTVTAYAIAEGRELWSTSLLAAGEVAHSEYANDVQLRWLDDRVVAFVWESAGRSVEALDPRTGACVAYRGPAVISSPEAPPAEPPIPGEAASFEWRWDGAAPDPAHPLYDGPVVVDTPVGRCSFARDERGAHLECVDASGRRVWGDDVAVDAMDDAALAYDDRRLYVSRFSNMAAGTILTAHDLATGAELWKMAPRGVGPVVHSIYLHDEQLRIERGRLVAIGWELGGRWIEVIDPATGRDLGNRLLADGDAR